MKTLIVVLCLVALSVTLTGCDNFHCRRLAREDCTFVPRKNCLNEEYAICNCRKAAKTESEKKRCDKVVNEYGY